MFVENPFHMIPQFENQLHFAVQLQLVVGMVSPNRQERFAKVPEFCGSALQLAPTPCTEHRELHVAISIFDSEKFVLSQDLLPHRCQVSLRCAWQYIVDQKMQH